MRPVCLQLVNLEHYMNVFVQILQCCLSADSLSSCNVCVGVPWREMADDGSLDDEGHDNFYYVLNNVIKGNHLPCPKTVTPLLPELPEVWIMS